MTCAVSEVTAFSAPGKVLLTGGYLVLDPKFTGLVFALNARIYVRITSTLPGLTSSTPSQEESIIVVKSPQFIEATWEYLYELANDDGGVKLNQRSS